MKKVIYFLSFAFILSACNKKSNETEELTIIEPIPENSIVGNWRLIEIYLYSGSGDDEFMPIESDKTLQFNADGTVTSNGSLCNMPFGPDSASYGTYIASDSVITSTSCTSEPLTMYYELSDSILILSKYCIEPCYEKYLKVE